jgi:hypothetical protein
MDLSDRTQPGQRARVIIYHQPSTIYHLLDRELNSNDRAQPSVFCRCCESPRPAQVIVIGERERAEAEFDRAFHEPLRVRRAVEQRKRGMAMQLGVHGSEEGEGAGVAEARAPDRASCYLMKRIPEETPKHKERQRVRRAAVYTRLWCSLKYRAILAQPRSNFRSRIP